MKEIILICVLLILGFACDDNLDIEPQQAISTNVALSDEQGIRTALIGTYDMLSQLPRSSGDLIINSDLLSNSGDLVWTGFVIPLTQLINKNIAVDNNAIENYWVYSYRTINQANTVLDAIDVVNENDRDAIAGELRFIRALVYFDLVNLFAQPWTAGNPESNLGVPLVQIPAEESLENPEIPRNSVKEVYDLIIDDLLFAKENLFAQNGVFANTFAASALLSRVYLMQEKFDLAVIEANRVISSEQYQLLPDLEHVYNQSFNTTEDIFTIQVTSQDGQNRVSFIHTGEFEGGGAFIGITDEHMAKYELGDLRANLFYNDQQSGTRRTSKWKLNERRDGNVTTIRLAELYLTRAEGRLKTDDEMGALEDVNVIRNRAGLPSLSTIDLESLLNERFLELAFEGHQFRDMKRNRKMIGGRAFDDPNLIYPIPQREMVVNRNMVQNDGY